MKEGMCVLEEDAQILVLIPVEIRLSIDLAVHSHTLDT